MKARVTSISGLDFQKSYISIAQYYPEEQSVALVAILPVDNSESDLWGNFGTKLKELRGKFKFTSPDVVCSLVSEHALFKRILVDDDEVDASAAIEWELEQQIIGSLNDYVFDFQEGRRLLQEKLKEFLVIAYNREAVHKISSIVKGCKLNPIVVDVDAVALINVFEANYREKTPQPALIIHGEPDVTKFILTQNGLFLDFGSFDYTAGTDSQAYLDKLLIEMNRFLAVNGTINAGSPPEAFLTGSVFSQQNFSEPALQQIPASEILHPFRKIGCHVGVDEEQLKSYATQLAVAVGLAIRGSEERS